MRTPFSDAVILDKVLTHALNLTNNNNTSTLTINTSENSLMYNLGFHIQTTINDILEICYAEDIND